MSEYKRYNVHVTMKYPNWDEKDGFDYSITARTKAEANKIARRRAEDAGRCDRQQPATFKATEMTAGEWMSCSAFRG